MTRPSPAATRSTVPNSSRCAGPTLVDDADVGRGDLAELGDLAEPTHAHLDDHDLGVVLDPAERQRKPDLVVLTLLGGDGRRLRSAGAYRRRRG